MARLISASEENTQTLLTVITTRMKGRGGGGGGGGERWREGEVEGGREGERERALAF